MASIKVFYATMSGGKTTTLLQTIHNYENSDLKITII